MSHRTSEMKNGLSPTGQHILFYLFKVTLSQHPCGAFKDTTTPEDTPSDVNHVKIKPGGRTMSAWGHCGQDNVHLVVFVSQLVSQTSYFEASLNTSVSVLLLQRVAPCYATPELRTASLYIYIWIMLFPKRASYLALTDVTQWSV